MLSTGFRVKNIAQALCISERTVTTHQQHIYKKLNIHHKVSLIKYTPYYCKFLSSLTLRERTIVVLITEGHCSQQVARELNISPQTVYSHRKTINKKLNSMRKKYDVLGIEQPE
jgi:DNA-binding CsgD family transcriptional regulator